MSTENQVSLYELVVNRSRSALLWGGGAFVVAAILLIGFPGIDLAVSNLFFDRTSDPAGRPVGFWLRDNLVLNFLFKAVDVISRAVLVTAIGLMIWRTFKRHIRFLPTAIVAFGLILGPAVTVNAVFKDHWDRARPRQVQEFGGEKRFTPAWVVSDQCDRNCSFTSGHAAAGFAFVVGHFVARSPVWLWLGLISGGLLGLSRIAVGAHFLSDIVFSFFLVYGIAALAARILVRISTVSARSIKV